MFVMQIITKLVTDIKYKKIHIPLHKLKHIDKIKFKSKLCNNLENNCAFTYAFY